MPNLEALLLSPHGRIGRRTYWTLLVLLCAGSLILSLVPFFGMLATLPLLWPIGCVIAQRLHDTDRRAWIVIAASSASGGATLLFFYVTMMASDPTHIVAAFGWALPTMLLVGAAMLAMLSLMLFAGLGPGSAGTNRSGAPEREPLSILSLLPRDLR